MVYEVCFEYDMDMEGVKVSASSPEKAIEKAKAILADITLFVDGEKVTWESVYDDADIYAVEQ